MNECINVIKKKKRRQWQIRSMRLTGVWLKEKTFMKRWFSLQCQRISDYIYRKPNLKKTKKQNKVNLRQTPSSPRFSITKKKICSPKKHLLTAGRPCPSVFLCAAALFVSGQRRRREEGMRTRWGWRLALRCRWCCGEATLHRRGQNWMSGGRFLTSKRPNPLIQTQPLLATLSRWSCR